MEETESGLLVSEKVSKELESAPVGIAPDTYSKTSPEEPSLLRQLCGLPVDESGSRDPVLVTTVRRAAVGRRHLDASRRNRRPFQRGLDSLVRVAIPIGGGSRVLGDLCSVDRSGQGTSQPARPSAAEFCQRVVAAGVGQSRGGVGNAFLSCVFVSLVDAIFSCSQPPKMVEDIRAASRVRRKASGKAFSKSVATIECSPMLSRATSPASPWR
jgi:hypothetical protein